MLRTNARSIPVENDTPDEILINGDEDVSVRRAVEAALAEAGGDSYAAAKLLEHEARANKPLYDLLMKPVLPPLGTAVWYAIRRYCQQERRLVSTPPNYDAKGKGERVVQLAISNREGLLSRFRLPIAGEPQLGKATREQVQEAIAWYQSRGSKMLQRAAWLTLIAKKVPEGKVVADVLTDQQAEALMKKTEGK